MKECNNCGTKFTNKAFETKTNKQVEKLTGTHIPTLTEIDSPATVLHWKGSIDSENDATQKD